jgi:hypothetical protein
MKYLVVLFLVALLAIMGSVSQAEPITRASDSCSVTLYIAEWVWIDLLCENGIYLDVEAGETGARGICSFVAGANTHAHLNAILTPPPGIPPGVIMDSGIENILVTSGAASWNYYIGNDELCLNWTGVNPAGTFSGDLFVAVSDVDITDRAGVYAGGGITANIWVW